MGSLEQLIIRQELVQRREEGCDTRGIEKRIRTALDNAQEIAAAEFCTLYDELDGLECDPAFPYHEPSTLDAIRALRPDGPRRMDVDLSDDDLLDRIYGAWLGRAAGCALGKPIEGWAKDRIDSYLAFANALPLDDYFPLVTGHPEGIIPHIKSCTRGNIEFMERDDDMDYPILGLLVLERKGVDFTPLNVANMWLGRMPYNLLYTAESAAYRNFVNRCWPPESATYRNPFREWIGAQIRADVFGYVTPGWPEMGAELAFRDASISHVKNGIYGEMFVAAMLSAAFVTDDIDKIIEIGLSEIPANCRLAEAVRDTMAWCREESDWEQVWNRINEKYGHYHGVHTINNAALVVMGMVYGENDYETGIVVAVRGGWDTDCNGATVGSILGAKFGARALPQKWVGVLNDRLLSAVRDCTDSKISDLAARTCEVAKNLMTEDRSVLASADTSQRPLVGLWSLEWSWQGGSAKYTLQVNKDLTGTLESSNNGISYPLRDVRTVGCDVQFSYVVDKGGWELELRFGGTVAADTIKGDLFSPVGEMSVTGTRIT